MKLTQLMPTRDLTTEVFGIGSDIDRFFGNFFRGNIFDDSTLFRNVWAPLADLIERENEYIVKIELPGVKKDEVKITLEDNVLTVSGEKKLESEIKEKNHYRAERRYGSFKRSFSLPMTVQAKNIDASYEDGILLILLPKAEEAKPRSIEIKVK